LNMLSSNLTVQMRPDPAPVSRTCRFVNGSDNSSVDRFWQSTAITVHCELCDTAVNQQHDHYRSHDQ